MKHYSKADIIGLDKIHRLNLINAITGIKPANLLGTISEDGNTNLAIISSVVHLGSNPALIGFVMRPTAEVPRHSYDNILATEYYTLNQVNTDMIEPAHYTSAKFNREVSEFEQCGFEEQFLDGHTAPYVAQSRLKIGLKLEEIVSMNCSEVKLIVGTVEQLYLEDEMLSEDGQLDLDAGEAVGISGLNRYYALAMLAEFPYARVDDWKVRKTKPDNPASPLSVV